jgi:hypothetical protein
MSFLLIVIKFVVGLYLDKTTFCGAKTLMDLFIIKHYFVYTLFELSILKV